MVKRIKAASSRAGAKDERPAADESAGAAQDTALAEMAEPAGLPSTVAKLATESMRLYGEWARTMLGTSEREIPAKDPRFADPAWRDNPLYRRLGQGYLAFCEAADRLAEGNPDWRKRERTKFLTGILTSSLAPTNTLLGNPAALKRFYETGGKSLVADHVLDPGHQALAAGLVETFQCRWIAQQRIGRRQRRSEERL